jgi:hypothetical protein
MNAPNFSAILDQAPTEIKRPPVPPAGPYLCIVEGIPVFDKSSKKQTDYVRFQLKPVQAMGDELQAAVAATGKNVGDFKFRTDFYLTEDAVYRLDIFLFEHLGIELGTSRKQAISMAPGHQVIANVTHRASQDGTSIFAEVNSTARV